MSLVSSDRSTRLVLRYPGQLWDVIETDWAGDDRQKWKVLACVHLRLHCQWNLDMIGRAFGHPKGHVHRLVTGGLAQLREALDVDGAADASPGLGQVHQPAEPLEHQRLQRDEPGGVEGAALDEFEGRPPRFVENLDIAREAGDA